TFQQYLEIERELDTRCEFLNGAVVAMALPSLTHTLIAGNALARLYAGLEGAPCRVRGATARIFVAEHNVATYPDIVVTCGVERVSEGRKDTLMDATLIVEVLSPTTKNYDRSEKFRYYRGLPSFAEYLLLAQDMMQAELNVRQPDGSWLWREYRDPESRIELKSIGCELVLKDLYARVEFETV